MAHCTPPGNPMSSVHWRKRGLICEFKFQQKPCSLISPDFSARNSLLPERHVSSAGHNKTSFDKRSRPSQIHRHPTRASANRHHNPPPDSTISEKSANWQVATKTDTNPPRRALQKTSRQNLVNPHHKRLRARFITRFRNASNTPILTRNFLAAP